MPRFRPDPPTLEAKVAELERRLAALERSSLGVVVTGPRDDAAAADGAGVRVRLGKLSDGSYGVERFTQAGARQTVSWA